MSTIIPTGMDEISGQFKIVQSGDILSTGDNSTILTAIVAGGSGIALCYPTDTGLSSGNPLYKAIKYVHVNFATNDPNLGKALPIVSGDLKTVSITCAKQTFNGVTVLGINVLGSNTIGVAPDGTVLNILVTGTLI